MIGELKEIHRNELPGPPKEPNHPSSSIAMRQIKLICVTVLC